VELREIFNLTISTKYLYYNFLGKYCFRKILFFLSISRFKILITILLLGQKARPFNTWFSQVFLTAVKIIENK